MGNMMTNIQNMTTTAEFKDDLTMSMFQQCWEVDPDVKEAQKFTRAEIAKTNTMIEKSQNPAAIAKYESKISEL